MDLQQVSESIDLDMVKKETSLFYWVSVYYHIVQGHVSKGQSCV